MANLGMTVLIHINICNHTLLGTIMYSEKPMLPAAGEPVERAVGLRHRQRVVVRQHQDVGQEADAAGAGGDVAEGRGGVVIAAAAVLVGDVDRNADVLAAAQVEIAEAVGGGGDLADFSHPSLRFKKLAAYEHIWSVRINERYRAVGERHGDTVTWVWVGTHNDFDKLFC